MPSRAWALLLMWIIGLLPRLALADTWPGEPFNGMQITYAIGGFALGAPTDKYGFGTTRTYEKAKIADSTLKVSGSVVNSWNDDGPTPATVSYVSVSLTAGNVSATQSYTLLGKKARSFELEVRVPKGATTASFGISLSGAYGNGESRGLSVSGSAKPSADLESACPKLDDKSAESKLGDILARYYKGIPKGLVKSGAENNARSIFDPKYEPFVCGGYQSKVLALLDGLKFDDDPCVAALLDDFDYGPIQAWWGGHQAVVLYPKGKDWVEHGLVLDPWMTQSPATYKIKDWGSVWSPASAGSFQGIGPSRAYEGGAYPTHGGVYADPKYGGKLTAAEKALVQSLPPDKRKQFDKMTPETQHEWLQKQLAAKKHATVIAHCPLEVVVSDGKAKTGVVDGTFIQQLPDVRYLRARLEDGGFFTQIEWPAGKAYQASFVGTAKGKADVVVQTVEGETTHFELAVAQGSAHTWKGGALKGDETIEGSAATSADWAANKSPLLVPLDHLGKKPSQGIALAPLLRLVGAALAGLVVLVLLVTFATRRLPGVARTTPATCPRCRAALARGAGFCSECGLSLR